MDIDSNTVARLLFLLDLHYVGILNHTAPFASHVLGLPLFETAPSPFETSGRRRFRLDLSASLWMDSRGTWTSTGPKAAAAAVL